MPFPLAASFFEVAHRTAWSYIGWPNHTPPHVKTRVNAAIRSWIRHGSMWLCVVASAHVSVVFLDITTVCRCWSGMVVGTRVSWPEHGRTSLFALRLVRRPTCQYEYVSRLHAHRGFTRHVLDFAIPFGGGQAWLGMLLPQLDRIVAEAEAEGPSWVHHPHGL